jgi:hypothetical protein
MKIFFRILVVVGIFSCIAAVIQLLLGHPISAQIVSGLVGCLVGLSGLVLLKVLKKNEKLL